MSRAVSSDLSVVSRTFGRVLTTAAILAGTGCSSSTGPSSVIPLDAEFELAPSHTAIVGTNGLWLRFVSVPVDTRCPVGMLCIVAGDAQVQIEAEQGGVGSTLNLSTDGLGRQAIFLSYAVQLVGLTPTPQLNQPTPQSSYRATLRVSLLGPD
jgi:hypothetical protein